MKLLRLIREWDRFFALESPGYAAPYTRREFNVARVRFLFFMVKDYLAGRITDNCIRSMRERHPIA